ncbi:hypothetical protein H310_08283 [Aphanomyces invadans]|uniref:Chromo domain-containing protein n=1 Tax=Aphanomyces invadans TaxID=157072 RepID=A0A024U083_9STRA|nr:hypothetical protein H310_08283 [Aphanomyces invadans]ETV99639.1 hypothetical protein H310_08283 [Aphanomyces invadans]|eukprot:XP_008872195.1 hypothetical protein H310_08283 [Aphanomyces invadans]
METEQLLPPYGLSGHHACRLKMYYEGGREFTEGLVEHITFGDQGFLLAGLRKVNGAYHILVHWLGLDELEAS